MTTSRLTTIAITILLLAAQAVEAQSRVPQNSMRGLYEWYRHYQVPLPNPAPESYVRYSWKQLESERGIYDFSPIDKDIAVAKAHGQRFAFRVMSACSGARSLVPSYLMAAAPNGTWFAADKKAANPDTYFPDWNDPAFVERARSLVEALGKRYDGDPYIAWVEIGTYGNWGEWHTYPCAYPSPTGAVTGSDDVKRAVVDMYVNAFPHTRLIMMTDDSVGLLYALSKSPKIGIRRDSLGHPWFESGLQRDPKRLAAVQERWKTAPFITESYGFPADTPDLSGVFATFKAQVLKYHVSLVGDGNIPSAKQLSPEALAAFYAVGDSAGYNLRFDATPVVGPPRSLRITGKWTNVGNAPTYDLWSVDYILLAASDGYKGWQYVSHAPINLCSLMPSSEGPATDVDDRITIPNALPNGGYALALRIADPFGTRRNMVLDGATTTPWGLNIVARFTLD